MKILFGLSLLAGFTLPDCTFAQNGGFSYGPGPTVRQHFGPGPTVRQHFGPGPTVRQNFGPGPTYSRGSSYGGSPSTYGSTYRAPYQDGMPAMAAKPN